MFSNPRNLRNLEFVFDPATMSYKADMTRIAHESIAGAAAALAQWTAPRIFLMAMDRVRELDPAWWSAAKHLPMEEALAQLRERFPIEPAR